MDSGKLFDAWDSEIETRFDPSQDLWTFRSGGKDGKFGTDDDIAVSVSVASQTLKTQSDANS